MVGRFSGASFYFSKNNLANSNSLITFVILSVGFSVICKERTFWKKRVLLNYLLRTNFATLILETKIVAVAPHLFDLSLHVRVVHEGYDISIRCGLLSYPFQRQCEGLFLGWDNMFLHPIFIFKAERGDSEAREYEEVFTICNYSGNILLCNLTRGCYILWWPI